jgi:hypothetical protein
MNESSSHLPTARIQSLRIYAPPHDRFFDALVEFCASFAGLMLAIEAQQAGTIKAYGPRQAVLLHGTHVSGIALSFFSHFFYDAFLKNSWPNEVRLAEWPLAQVPKSDAPLINSVARIAASHLEAAFVRYYEAQKQSIRAKYGDVSKWPSEWNFARILRNTFAHGGAVNFDNPKAAPVSWKTLTYSPADNGRVITFVDITPVETILLLEELDALL